MFKSLVNKVNEFTYEVRFNSTLRRYGYRVRSGVITHKLTGDHVYSASEFKALQQKLGKKCS